MKRIFMCLLTLVALCGLLGVTASAAETATVQVTGVLDYVMAEEVFSQLNNYRASNGLSKLVLDERLTAAAMERAVESSIAFSHTRPNGRSYASVLSDYSYNSSGAAENLIYTSGNGDAAKMVAKWMSADKNCSTLMSESYTTAGIGIYRSGGVTYLANLLIG